MPADQVPSDAEVEALIAGYEETARRNRAGLETEGFWSHDYLRAMEENNRRTAATLRALLRERQAVPARIAAAVMAERDACAKLCDALDQFGRGTTGKTALAWSAAAGSLAGQIHGRPVPEGTDHLAAQLAAAREEGRQEGILSQPTWHAYMAACRALNWRNAQLHRHGIEPEAIPQDAPHYPTPPAGGADDA